MSLYKRGNDQHIVPGVNEKGKTYYTLINLVIVI